MSKHFTEKLFGCLDHLSVCGFAVCVPCGIYCLQAAAVKTLDTYGGAYQPYCLAFCCGPVGAAINRGKIRKKFDIGGFFPDDLCVWCWCGCCAACQEYRETHKRYDKVNQT